MPTNFSGRPADGGRSAFRMHDEESGVFLECRLSRQESLETATTILVAAGVTSATFEDGRLYEGVRR